MSRPEEAREPVPDTTADWYRRFEAELASRGLPTSEVERTATSTRAEAEAAGETPGDLYVRQSSTPARSPLHCGTTRLTYPLPPRTTRHPTLLPASAPPAPPPHLPRLRPQPPWSCA